MADRETFSVCQFFPDGAYEYVRRDVVAPEAVDAALSYATSVGARVGTTVRVIITDQADFVVFEWRREGGITFGADSSHIGKLKGGAR